MTHEEMIQRLSQKMGVTPEEAKASLEVCDWDLLDAALLIEQEKGAPDGESYTTRPAETPAAEAKRESSAVRMLKKAGRAIAKLISLGNRNRFEVRRGDEVVLELPVTALVLLLIVAFWVCLPLLVVGLFTGFRYAFSGADLGREGVNRAMDQAAEAAEKVKRELHSEG